MAVYKRGKTYWIRFQWNGQEIRQSARTASRSAALDHERHVREELGRIHRGGKERYSYRQAMTRFIGQEIQSLKVKTQKRYITSGKALYSHFVSLYLDQINKKTLSEFVAYRKREGVSDATVRRDLTCLSAMLSAAMRWDWIDANPVKGMDKRNLKESEARVRFLTLEEFNKLIAAAPNLAHLIQFAVETGMRSEEQFGLTWGQVDLPRREVRLTGTKNGTSRTVPLSDKALQIIQSLPRHIKLPYVFWYRPQGSKDVDTAKRYTSLQRPWKQALKAAGIEDFKWHDLRHTFASWAVQRGADMYKLQVVLGHKSPQMTQRYAHLRSDDLHEIAQLFGTKVGTGITV